MVEKIKMGNEASIIGENLKALRLSHGYSQRQIAAELGTSFQQVQKYEKGQNRIPVEKLYRLKFFLNVPYSSFFDGLPVDNVRQKRFLKNAKILPSKLVWVEIESKKVGLIIAQEEGEVETDPDIFHHLERFLQTV